MNKKALSLLLAASMVFSMNAVAFAEEAVVADEAVEVVEVVDADTEEVVEVEADEEDAEETDKEAQSSNTQSECEITLGSYKAKVSYNSTPMYTGAKIDPAQLNIRFTVSQLSASSQLFTVTKVKFRKGYKKTSTGTVYVGFSAVDKSNKSSLTKADKKILQAVLKASKKDTPLALNIPKFSVSMSNVKLSTEKKPSSVSSDWYALSILYNSNKDKIKAVKVAYTNSKGKVKTVKVKKSNYSYSNGTLKFTGNYEGTVVSANTSKPTVSSN